MYIYNIRYGNTISVNYSKNANEANVLTVHPLTLERHRRGVTFCSGVLGVIKQNYLLGFSRHSGKFTLLDLSFIHYQVVGHTLHRTVVVSGDSEINGHQPGSQSFSSTP